MKKRLFLILVLLTVWLVCTSGQNYMYQQKMETIQKEYYVPRPQEIPLINITNNQVENGWALHGRLCAGCASYYYQILISDRQYQGEDGVFYYYVYFKFYSNSHYGNGNLANTYMSGVSLYVNNVTVSSITYMLLPAGEVVWGGWIRNTTNNMNVSFYVNQISIH